MEMNKTVTWKLCTKNIYEVLLLHCQYLVLSTSGGYEFFQLKLVDLFDLKEHPSASLPSEPLSLGIGRSEVYLADFWFIYIIYISS